MEDDTDAVADDADIEADCAEDVEVKDTSANALAVDDDDEEEEEEEEVVVVAVEKLVGGGGEEELLAMWMPEETTMLRISPTLACGNNCSRIDIMSSGAGSASS